VRCVDYPPVLLRASANGEFTSSVSVIPWCSVLLYGDGASLISMAEEPYPLFDVPFHPELHALTLYSSVTSNSERYGGMRLSRYRLLGQPVKADQLVQQHRGITIHPSLASQLIFHHAERRNFDAVLGI